MLLISCTHLNLAPVAFEESKWNLFPPFIHVYLLDSGGLMSPSCMVHTGPELSLSTSSATSLRIQSVPHEMCRNYLQMLNRPVGEQRRLLANGSRDNLSYAANPTLGFADSCQHNHHAVSLSKRFIREGNKTNKKNHRGSSSLI